MTHWAWSLLVARVPHQRKSAAYVSTSVRTFQELAEIVVFFFSPLAKLVNGNGCPTCEPISISVLFWGLDTKYEAEKKRSHEACQWRTAWGPHGGDRRRTPLADTFECLWNFRLCPISFMRLWSFSFVSIRIDKKKKKQSETPVNFSEIFPGDKLNLKK